MPESTNPLSSFVVPNSDQTHYTPTTAEPLDLDALEVVANAATAGPWWTGVGLGSFQYTVEGPDADSHPVAQRLIHPDATHVANFDPPTVLALIAALKEARAGLADAWDEGCKFGYDYGRIEGRDDCAYAVPTANPYIDRSEAP